MSPTSPRVVDAARSLATAATAGGRGAWRTARRGGQGAALGARGFAERRRGAGALLAVGLARLLLQVPADLLLLLLARGISALQTLLGVEAPARRLDAEERALLWRVFGSGIDARPVRVKSGRLGLLGLPRRAFVVGDTVHVPTAHRKATAAAAAPRTGHRDEPFRTSLARRAPALLVHELTHVWQHQRHGTRYLSECLLAQWLGDGYNVAVAVEAGRGWEELNFEQQAELLERACSAGWFDDGLPAGARLWVQLTDPRRDDGFLVALDRGGGEAAAPAGGWRDATPLLAAGLAAMRAEPRSRRRRRDERC